MNRNQLENPVMGYVVIAAALIVGMLSATVFGQNTSHPPESRHYFAIQRDPVLTNNLALSPTPEDNSSPKTHPRDVCPGQRRWVLGVRVTTTTTGCLISEVIPGSPAAQSGFAVGDRIVAVNGQQVGLVGPQCYLGSQCYPLNQAIDQSPKQVVTLLMQDGRTKSLRSLSLRLATVNQTLGHDLEMR